MSGQSTEQPSTNDTENWICPSCGKENRNKRRFCWNCETTRYSPLEAATDETDKQVSKATAESAMSHRDKQAYASSDKLPVSSASPEAAPATGQSPKPSTSSIAELEGKINLDWVFIAVNISLFIFLDGPIAMIGAILLLGLNVWRLYRHKEELNLIKQQLVTQQGVSYQGKREGSCDPRQAENAIEYHTRALAVARETGDRRDEGNQLGNLGLAYRDLGQVKKAREVWKQALRIFEEIKSPHAERVRSLLESLEK